MTTLALRLLDMYRAGILEAPKLDEPLGKEDQWIASDPGPIQRCLATVLHIPCVTRLQILFAGNQRLCGIVSFDGGTEEASIIRHLGLSTRASATILPISQSSQG